MNRRIVSLCLAVCFVFSGIYSAAAAETVTGSYAGAYAKIDIDHPKENVGMTHIDVANQTVARAGRNGILLDCGGEPELYMKIDVDNKMMYDIRDGIPIEVTVDYFDEGDGFFEMAYDAYGVDETAGGIWDYTELVRMTNSKEWKSYTFYVDNMRMANRADGGDFRLGVYSIQAGRSPSSVVIGSVVMQTAELREPLRLVNATENKEGNIYSKGEKVEINLNLKNMSEREIHGTFSYKVKLWGEREVGGEEGLECVFPGLETGTLTLCPPEVDEYGVYDVMVEGTLEYTDGETAKPIPFSTSVQFSVVWEVAKEDINDKLGTALLINEYNWSASNGVGARIAAKAGLRWNREEIQWKTTELSPGVYKLPDKMRKELELAREAGMNNHLGLLYANPVRYDSYAGNCDPPTSENELKAFGDWCEWLARETKGLVQAFGAWNEYNIENFNITRESPEHYAKLLEVMYTSIKKGNPDALLLGFETAQIDHAFNERVFKAGGLKWMDVAAVHPYDWSGHFNTQKIIDDCIKMKEMMREYGDEKPIWWTEFGFGTYYTWDEQRNNFVMAYALQCCYDLADVVYQFRFQDDLRIGGIENAWGLINSYEQTGRENGAKPSYVAFCALNNLIGSNAEATGVIQDGTTYAFRFYNRKMGKDIAVLASEYDTQYMTLRLGTKELDVYDVYGNKLEPIVSENGIYDFNINQEPFYIAGNFNSFEREKEPQARIIPLCMEDSALVGEAVTFSLKNNTGGQVRIVPEEKGEVRVEKSGEAADGTLNVTYRTSKNMAEQACVNLLVVNEKGQIIYRGKGLIHVLDKPLDVAVTAEQTNENSEHWRARVEITNFSKENTISGTLRVIAPEKEAAYIKPRSFASLFPGETCTLYLNLPVQTVKNSCDFQLQISLDNGYETTIRKGIDFSVAKYAEKKPVIDGNIDADEWNGIWFGADCAEHYGSDAYSGNKVWNGPDDSSFSGITMWDEEKLYLMIYAKDDIHYSLFNGPSTDMWRTDSVQFGLDDHTDTEG